MKILSPALEQRQPHRAFFLTTSTSVLLPDGRQARATVSPSPSQKHLNRGRAPQTFRPARRCYHLSNQVTCLELDPFLCYS